MKASSDRGKKLITFLYMLGLLGMISILVAIGISRKEPEQKINEETYQDITAEWTLDREGTQLADVKKLGEYMDEKTGVLSMYYQLPEMDKDLSLVYRSKDVYTKILIDEEVVYETAAYESRFYNRSPGNLWNSDQPVADRTWRSISRGGFSSNQWTGQKTSWIMVGWNLRIYDRCLESDRDERGAILCERYAYLTVDR